MTHSRYHDTFKKEVGLIKVESYGGGSPRWVRIDYNNESSTFSLSVEEVRDLHYALTRFLEEFA